MKFLLAIKKIFAQGILGVLSAGMIAGCATQRAAGDGVPVNPIAEHETVQDVQKAIDSVANVMTNKVPESKFCPRCGRHYSSDQAICPLDQTPLEKVEE